MSVTFSVLDCPHGQTDSWDCAQCEPLFLNMANGNALAIMALVGIEPCFDGTIEARVLTARCRRALARMARGDFAHEFAAHEPDYCRARVRQLLALAFAAGGGAVAWE